MCCRLSGHHLTFSMKWAKQDWKLSVGSQHVLVHGGCNGPKNVIWVESSVQMILKFRNLRQKKTYTVGTLSKNATLSQVLNLVKYSVHLLCTQWKILDCTYQPTPGVGWMVSVLFRVSEHPDWLHPLVKAQEVEDEADVRLVEAWEESQIAQTGRWSMLIRASALSLSRPLAYSSEATCQLFDYF